MNIIDTTTSPTGEVINIVDPNSVGFNGLTSEDFLEMMVVQLQNQDPTEPVSNSELLEQISQMRALEANIDLEEQIEQLVISQNAAATNSFTSAASSLIGKYVQAVDENDFEREGTVDRAIFRDGKAYVGIGDEEIPLERVTEVHDQEP